MSDQPGYFVIDDLLTVLPAPDDLPTDSILSRTLHRGAGVKAMLFGFAAGQELSEHTAARPAVLHILTGTARVTLGADDMTLTAGAWVHMPAHLPHSVHAETPLTMLLLLLEGA